MKTKQAVISVQIDKQLKDAALYIIQNELKLSLKQFIQNKLETLIKEYETKK